MTYMWGREIAEMLNPEPTVYFSTFEEFFEAEPMLPGELVCLPTGERYEVPTRLRAV